MLNPLQASGLPPVDVDVDGALEATAPTPTPTQQPPPGATSANSQMPVPADGQDAASPAYLLPQQVYVNAPSATTGLTEQFQSFGINEQNKDQATATTQQEEGENDIAAPESNEQPLKLFVGQVPKNMNEEDIFPTFDKFGPLKDVAIIRDRHTGLHKGCAFVTYWSTADGEQARNALHDKFTFDGARRPAQVKVAEPSGKRRAAMQENKLFIGMLSRTAGEDEVRELFAPFGEIKEIYMIRNHDGTSKCAAFLKFAKRESAVEAIKRLHSNIVMNGSNRPLIVKFADNKQQRQQRHMRNIRRQEMMAAMHAAAGYPPGAYPHMPPTMPMGMHQGHPEAPQYPMQLHHHPHHPYGAFGPAANHTVHAPPHAHAPMHAHQPHPFMFAPQHYGSMPPYGYQQSNRMDQRQKAPRPREGPAGANLFVYHLPHDLTDADLATAFNSFGNVISAKVYVDKFTGESKGFGFVSYDSVISAETAIEQMNGFQIGNKRLKVQHKRVHKNKNNNSSSSNNHNRQGGGGSSNGESSHENSNDVDGAAELPFSQGFIMPTPPSMLAQMPPAAIPHIPQIFHGEEEQQQQHYHDQQQPAEEASQQQLPLPTSGLKHGQPGLPSQPMPMM